ncbi:IS110 family transposase [Micromonospora sp. CPCC 205556]|uniref:IS110 family transposase n=1 Tax=Micromonospora sp. CPCC 205556 TaxID=3122398 RepID=UPI002FF3AAFD
MSILAEQVDVVIGVDAHTDTHTAAVVSAAGAVLAELTVPADDGGAAALLAWADDHAGALRRQWVIDGARSHGVGVARVLLAAGETVLDAARVPGSARRRGGKSDRLDAIQVAASSCACRPAERHRAGWAGVGLGEAVVCRGTLCVEKQ